MNLKLEAIEKAIKKHRIIYPCSTAQNLYDSFTVEDDILLFWYNTEDNSTHIITEKIGDTHFCN